MTLVLLFALTACTDKGAASFDRGAMLGAMVDEQILPTHAALRTASSALLTHTTAFCEAPDALDLSASRDAWSAASAALSQAQVWGFGPARNFGVELSKNLDKWPGSAENIEAIVSGTDPIDVSTLDYTDRVVGLPAIEYLLWSEGETDPLIAAYAEPRRCELLRALVEAADGVVAAYVDAWAPEGDDYGGELARAGQGSATYVSEQAAVTEVLSGMITATTFASAMRLGVPLGDSNGGVALPDEVESPYADASLERVQATLASLRAVYVGDGALGISGYVRSRQASGDVDGAVMTALDEAEAALTAIPTPLEDAVVSDPAAVRAAIDALDRVTVVLTGDVSTLLGVNPTAVEADND